MNICNIRNTFERKKQLNWDKIYFAVDLHGTIIPSGENPNDVLDKRVLYPYAQEVLSFLSKRKDVGLILWTSTPNNRLVEIYKWFFSIGIEFEQINENEEVQNTPRSCFDEKFYFNVLIDDRAGFEPETDWLAIKNELINLGEWK